MSIRVKWKAGGAPLLLPPANGSKELPAAPARAHVAPAPLPDPLPPGVIRVLVPPPPVLLPKVAAFWFSEEIETPLLAQRKR